MEHDGDRWVQRLRDGEVPPTWRIVLVTVLVSALGAFLLVEMFVQPDVTRRIADATPRSGVFLLVPPILLLTGPGVALAAWSSGRRDRRTLARIRATGGRPVFHLPVETAALVAGEEFADPKPEVWTVDDTGLHGWTPDHARPVHALPWERIRAFGLANTVVKGVRQDWGIWVSTANGHVVLAPRTTLGRPFAAGGLKRPVLVRVLRSLRAELDPAGATRTTERPGARPGDTPLGSPAAPTG
ncbi:hypothetical protein [Curtobacterium sp. MCBD17_023]|uniref:hypothetical protein n=2 Tax=unclassified Curtobacterium TaxID=257496 RepID=UPI000D8D0F65|nr:hypothetical protein [Curtobacterium sp. MCBD17_023]PYY50840.1 hypothetical protein DEI84_03405 [Curtobacterium sp. MCBD17_023]